MNTITNLRALAALAALAFSGALAAQESGEGGNIEELVVTGSYLKRSAQDSPSPLSVVSSTDIEDSGAPDVAELVQAMPWQSGSQSRTPSFSGDFNADGRVNINLRNLGHGSTLVLVNGKRQVASWYNPRGNATANVNALLPNIAIERVEVVKDGASALYGSDAIAGVVNFINKRDFEGFDFSYQFTTDDATSKGDTQMMEVIFGAQSDQGGIVAAASVLNRDPITIGDRYERYGGSTASSTGQPGRVLPSPGQAIVWASHATAMAGSTALAGKTVYVDDMGNPAADAASGDPGLPRRADGSSFGQADVNCEDAAAFDGQSGTLGVVGGNICAYDFGSFFNIVGEESLRKFNVFGHYDFSDSVEVYFEFAANNSEFDRFNSLNPNAPIRRLTNTHPGNVEDAYRRGIDPIEVAVQSRMLGGTVDLIGTNYRPLATFTDISRSDERMVIGAVWDFGMNSRNWTLDASFTATESDNVTTNIQDTLTSNMDLALRGFGGPNCTSRDPAHAGRGNTAYKDSGGDFDQGDCYYFNPFGNAQFNRDGEHYADGESLELRNPKELYEWLLGRIASAEEFRQRVIDVVATGDVADLANGPVSVALGYQRRSDSGGFNYDAAVNTNNLDFAYGAQDWYGRLTTSAVFAEVAIPVTSILDVNLALRYEDFDELSQSTTDPKITGILRWTDSLTLRGSYSSSYRVPSLQQLFGSITTVANESDARPDLDTDEDRDSAYRPAITTGNPDLLPEEADAWNIGFTWAPPDSGLEVSVDYYKYDYTNIITRQSPSRILAADNVALEAWGKANASSVMIDEIARLEAVKAGVGDRERVIRNGENGGLLRILPDFVNANSAEVSGIDFTISYAVSTGIGDLRFSILGALVEEYEVEVPGDNGAPATRFDAVGQYNERNPVAAPLPELKLNSSFSWRLGNHRLYTLVKHVDEVDYGFDIATDAGSAAARYWRATVTLAHGAGRAGEFFTRNIDSMTTVDVHYTYTLGELPFVSDSWITVGALNATDEEPPWAPVNNAFDGTLHDPRGRIWYLRVGGSL